MDKYFLCLANSYKHGNRCLAGVEVDWDEQTQQITLRKDDFGNPIWFRPIYSGVDGGAVPNDVAVQITPFSLILATNVVPCPDGAQRENYSYENLEMVRLGTESLNEKKINVLEQISSKYRKVIFGNTGKAVDPGHYATLDYSLLLVHATNVVCRLEPRENKAPQPRIKFTYKDYEYDMPVTDPIFRYIIEDDLARANAYSDYYLLLSLGVENEQWHTKLIASVFIC